MLQRLSISNYALISSLSVEFDNGFSVITGETGAGKSILLGALGFVLGNRADSNILFDDSKKCVVEASFVLNNDRLKSFFEENDIDFEDECIIRRELNPQKKSRSFVNDTPVSLQVLKELGSHLVDIHSQHDSLLLCNPDFQLSLLDDAANNQELLIEYKKSYKEYTSAKNELERLRQKSINNIDENDYLKFQLDELVKSELQDNEYVLRFTFSASKFCAFCSVLNILNSSLEHLQNSVTTEMLPCASHLVIPSPTSGHPGKPSFSPVTTVSPFRMSYNGTQ